jgi:CheY-like chemotaxis protein
MTENNKILLVDDDERNIFALSAYLKAKSTSLKQLAMAENALIN